MNQTQLLAQLSTLTTENINPQSIDIDVLPTLEKLRIINAEDQKVAAAVSLELPAIAAAVDLITQIIHQGGRLIYIGAGTSGRLGILDAVECPPTYGIAPNTIIGIMAGGAAAFIHAEEGVEDQEDQGATDLAAIHLTKHDLVCGISASGRTPYVIGGLKYAKSCGSKTIALACNQPSLIAAYADLKIEVRLGAEVISGSTRMKAGTAQKLILNMLSTATLINLGKVYKNLMVEVKTSNAKLQARAIKIIMDATAVDLVSARHYLYLANNQVKTAIVMIIRHCDAATARAQLDTSAGIIRKPLLT